MKLAVAVFVAALIAVIIGVALIAASQGAFGSDDLFPRECGPVAACAEQ